MQKFRRQRLIALLLYKYSMKRRLVLMHTLAASGGARKFHVTIKALTAGSLANGRTGRKAAIFATIIRLCPRFSASQEAPAAFLYSLACVHKTQINVCFDARDKQCVTINGR